MITQILFFVFIILLLIFFLKLGFGKTIFSYKIKSKLSQETLWKLIKESFIDSTKSKIWPNKLEKVKTKNLKKGAKFNVTYKTLFGESNFGYLCAEYSEGNFIKYQADNKHPFKGGATIEVIKLNKGSQLNWHGKYTHPFISSGVLYLKFYLLSNFFKTLEKNIRDFESKNKK